MHSGNLCLQNKTIFYILQGNNHREPLLSYGHFFIYGSKWKRKIRGFGTLLHGVLLWKWSIQHGRGREEKARAMEPAQRCGRVGVVPRDGGEKYHCTGDVLRYYCSVSSSWPRRERPREGASALAGVRHWGRLLFNPPVNHSRTSIPAVAGCDFWLHHHILCNPGKFSSLSAAHSCPAVGGMSPSSPRALGPGHWSLGDNCEAFSDNYIKCSKCRNFLCTGGCFAFSSPMKGHAN